MGRPGHPPARTVRVRVGALGLLGALALTAGCGANPALAARSGAGDEAWVATQAFQSDPGSSLARVDLRTARADGTVTTASEPSGLAATPDGRFLAVTNAGDDTLSRVDAATGAVTGTARVGLDPDAVAVAPGGTGAAGLALVADFGSDTVTPVDLGTMRPEAPIPVGAGPDAVAVTVVSPGAAPVVLVANARSGTLTPINLATRRPGAPVPVGDQPDAVAVVHSPLGPAALVADFGSTILIPVNLSTMAPGTPVTVPGNPTGISVAPGGTQAWVVAGSSVVGVAGGTMTAGAPLGLPGVAEAVALQGASTAWVALQAGALVAVHLPAGPVGPVVHVGGRPCAVAIPVPTP